MFELMPFARKNHAMTGYNPFREFEEFENKFWNHGFLTEFKTDIQDVGDAYVMETDLPGFKKEDININIDGDCLTIQAQRHSEAEEKDKKGNYIRCERSYGSYSRSFDISTVKADEIKAEYKDGVLKLTMPKQAQGESTAKRLEIE